MASQGPNYNVFFNKYITARAKAWAIPNLGEFLAHNGEKWISKQILPPLLVNIKYNITCTS